MQDNNNQSEFYSTDPKQDNANDEVDFSMNGQFAEPNLPDQPLDEILSQQPSFPLDPSSMDLTKLAVKETGSERVAKRVLTTLKVGKPPKEAFVRSHPDPNCWKPFEMIELKDEQKFYLLSPEIGQELAEEGEATLVRASLVPAVDKFGNPFLWLLKQTERENVWHVTLRRAAEVAKDKWVRCYANTKAGYYDILVASNQSGEPDWPEEPYSEMLNIAFGDRVIMKRDHNVLRTLRGEI